MGTHGYKIYHIDRFWDDEFKTLDYIYESFNDPDSVDRWVKQGFSEKICGALCDMRSHQPSWNDRFIDLYRKQGWQDIGTAYYKMTTGTVMPEHQDLYKKYIEIFDLQGQEHAIRRAVVFLEDWCPGHYFDCMGQAFVHWRAGDTAEWTFDTPHSAANIGLVDRYTLQITGHV